jgi:LacI family transcriptional regulator
MNDVAKAAGVSASTVSRTLAKPGRVAAATAEHVRRVAAELGYRVNPLGAGPRVGRSSRIALVVSDVTNPVYTEIIRGAQSAASDAGYVLLLIDTQESDQLERDGLSRALPAVDGVILAGTRMSDPAISALAGQCPVVVLNRELPDVPGVRLDDAHGMRAIAEHLRSLGHHSLMYIAGPAASSVDGVRWRSLREATRDLGCKASRSGPCVPTVEGGREAAAALLTTLPTAIVAYNDQLAIGLMLALQSRGIRVPEHVSIVGFDNTVLTQMVTPPLTTVAAPLREQGRAAVNMVLAAAGNGIVTAGRDVSLPVKLVARGSTGPPRRTGEQGRI